MRSPVCTEIDKPCTLQPIMETGLGGDTEVNYTTPLKPVSKKPRGGAKRRGATRRAPIKKRRISKKKVIRKAYRKGAGSRRGRKR